MAPELTMKRADHRHFALPSAFFCEDVRAESSGLTSIVGIMPENAVPAAYPVVMPKLAVHARCVVSLPLSIDRYTLEVFPPGAEKPSAKNDLDRAALEKLLVDYKSDAKFGTLVTTMQFANLVVQGPGIARVIARIDDTEYELCVLQFGEPIPDSPTT